jgi:hypothetical protein
MPFAWSSRTILRGRGIQLSLEQESTLAEDIHRMSALRVGARSETFAFLPIA